MIIYTLFKHSNNKSIKTHNGITCAWGKSLFNEDQDECANVLVLNIYYYRYEFIM